MDVLFVKLDHLCFYHSCILPKLEMCFTDDDVAHCFVSYATDFEMYLQYITGLPQAEACVSDKNTQYFFKARGLLFSKRQNTHLIWCEIAHIKPQLFFCSVQQYANTELAHLDAQVLSVNTYLQRPLERIQTYKTVLKVRLFIGIYSKDLS